MISDRFRTTINVFGDSIGCAIVQHLSRKELNALDLARNKVDLTEALPINSTYDNPTFINQTETIQDDAMIRTKL